MGGWTNLDQPDGHTKGVDSGAACVWSVCGMRFCVFIAMRGLQNYQVLNGGAEEDGSSKGRKGAGSPGAASADFHIAWVVFTAKTRLLAICL